MHLEAEQYKQYLQRAAAAAEKWQDDIESYTATIEKQRQAGKPVAGMEINRNNQQQRFNLFVNEGLPIITAYMQAMQAEIDTLRKRAAAPGSNADNYDVPPHRRTLIRDLPRLSDARFQDEVLTANEINADRLFEALELLHTIKSHIIK